ncbi:DUF983 domain-containing protein [Aquimarina sp. BL5]|uniref:DUF983 domain-containing protein n=1 Tax=Aquimarina sp. BL5 TaxID=1714860 RepID=UPI000E54CF05|nr:DUF983 domain-containing protein [Aquimarina sp. BL5]AXT52546.1 DUF983 domain-containing protein [Aquimarina sp. BL5]RKN11268.1 DUF983 domain-containing protein [Aquimarina sp. BL5]
MSFLKGTKIFSVFTGTCPVCQNESMYKEPNPYKLGKVFQMHERCSHCNTKYKIEPSFFYGAMYVSYGVGIAFAVAAFVIGNLFLKLNLLNTFFVIVGTLLVFFPVILRLSRNIWINIFMHYGKKKNLS